MTKKLISICICLITVLALTSCGKVAISDDMTPTETTAAFLDSFKAQEWENMDQIYAGQSNDFTSAYGFLDDEEGLSKTLAEAFLSKLCDFDYDIAGEDIAEDGETARVDFVTEAYDMTEVFNGFYQEYMSQALDVYTDNSSAMTDDALQKMALEILKEQVGAAEKTYEGTAYLTLTKTDGRWVVDEIDESNSDFLNAISGGMMDVANDVIHAREDN